MLSTPLMVLSIAIKLISRVDVYDRGSEFRRRVKVGDKLAPRAGTCLCLSLLFYFRVFESFYLFILTPHRLASRSQDCGG